MVYFSFLGSFLLYNLCNFERVCRSNHMTLRLEITWNLYIIVDWALKKFFNILKITSGFMAKTDIATKLVMLKKVVSLWSFLNYLWLFLAFRSVLLHFINYLYLLERSIAVRRACFQNIDKIFQGSINDHIKIPYTKFQVSMSFGLIYRLFQN